MFIFAFVKVKIEKKEAGCRIWVYAKNKGLPKIRQPFVFFVVIV